MTFPIDKQIAEVDDAFIKEAGVEYKGGPIGSLIGGSIGGLIGELTARQHEVLQLLKENNKRSKKTSC